MLGYLLVRVGLRAARRVAVAVGLVAVALAVGGAEVRGVVEGFEVEKVGAENVVLVEVKGCGPLLAAKRDLEWKRVPVCVKA